MISHCYALFGGFACDRRIRVVTIIVLVLVLVVDADPLVYHVAPPHPCPARRGAELVRVDIERIERQPSGLLVKIPRTKTNRSGKPEYVGVPSFPGHPLCPVRALDVWLTHAKITSGPVFVTLAPTRTSAEKRMRAQDVSRRLQAIAEEAGPEGVWRSHSLRRGVVTAAEAAGVARSRTRTLTGWKSDAMFAVYADHREKIAASPLINIYAREER